MTTTSLTSYRLLGRSGLRVSPLALGTMTFGTEWGWGADRAAAARLLAMYLDAGGNFIDTADGYTGGTSEDIIGQYLADRGRRDRVVLASKYTFAATPGDPNSGGNGRKNLHRALDGSLRRLRTDYLDVYWLHAWDGLTPVEEVVEALGEVVRAGKVRYLGLSDVPAWYLARAQTLAELRGSPRFVGLQLEHSLLERNLEREHAPAARELGVGLTCWSPLASGLLTGKYTRDGLGAAGAGRLAVVKDQGNPAFLKLFTERNWRIIDELVAVARALGRAPAELALAWVANRPGVTSTIIGATSPEQLEANLRVLERPLPADAAARLDDVSRPELVHPYHFFQPDLRAMMTGGTQVTPTPWHD